MYNWRKKALDGGKPVINGNIPASAWSNESKFCVLLETASLNEHELSEYCRKRGLYVEQIQQWRGAAVAGQSKDVLNQIILILNFHMNRLILCPISRPLRYWNGKCIISIARKRPFHLEISVRHIKHLTQIKFLKWHCAINTHIG